MSTGKQEQSPSGGITSTVTLDQIIDNTRLPENEAKEVVRTLVDDIMGDKLTYQTSAIQSINARIAMIDRALSEQLAAVMHHAQFQKLEGSWRGLNYLVMNTETATDLKLHVFNCGKRELQKSFEKATEFDQSVLFKKIYEDEFGTPGGVPYGALIGDFEFNNHPDDIGLLTQLSNVAASGFSPFLSAASCELFGFDNWETLPNVRDLAKIFDTPAYIKWRAFRETEDSRFAYLTMPRTLARLPYGANTKPVDEFAFEEVDLGADLESIKVPHDQYCWMNTAYVLGTRLTNAYSRTGFCTAIRGAENGGKVEDLPAHIFTSDEGDLDLKCPTEVGITDRRLAELDKLGFLPLAHYKNTDYSVFFGAQSTQKPKKYDRPQATANAAISARLPYMMACSRFAHFLKCIAHDKLGSFMERDDCEAWLNRWIMNYVTADPKPSPREKAKFPLADAKVEVQEIPGRPGAYDAIIHMRPWLQLEELNTSMRMVTRIPRKA